MSKLLRVLEKVGLVETGEPAVVETPAAPEPVARREPPARRAAPTPAPEPAPAPAATAAGPVEQRPFEQIYAAQGLPAAPFSAEKLLRVLEGLAALDPSARKAAVEALDAADETWAIDDVLLDAEHKKRALETARRELEQHARHALETAREAIATREARQQEATQRIRQQIADLEALLEREITRATEEKGALEAEARATKEACQREILRYDQEGMRLSRIAAVFGDGRANPTANP
ncbi:MAG TPA: hypothetical protein PKO41_04245 [Dokdonella sp.]|uniref:hypothetical protein n=1 Tax=Dokdonella sp. TaxID=2291710 RepID=UPI0025C13FB1|nr:hypothetical protein [Dokdonella sp.]MBX3692186.1 hypothetical protein [Dokdonella sp.]HNR91619.1 hypothetical protein [Dokdonella sp.]